MTRPEGAAAPSTGTLDFEEFYRDRHDHLYRALAITFRDPGLAAESVDEAFTRAFERWDDVAGYINPAGWVYRVAFNWGTSALRRRRREAVGHETDAVATDSEVSDPRLLAAVRTLPLEQRAVVVTRYLLDWSTHDTAEALGISSGTVKSRLHRALAELNRRLSHTREER